MSDDESKRDEADLRELERVRDAKAGEHAAMISRAALPSETSALFGEGPPIRKCPECGAEIFLDCAACALVADVRAGRASQWEEQRKDLPERLRDCTFDDEADFYTRVSIHPRKFTAARALIEDRALVLFGPSAAGKTSLVCALLRERIALGHGPAFFIRAGRLATAQIKHRAGAGEAPDVVSARKAPLLVIDDIGQNDTHSMSEIGEILFDRLNSKTKATWITTFLDRDQFAAHPNYGGGLARRLYDDGHVVNLPGKQVKT